MRAVLFTLMTLSLCGSVQAQVVLPAYDSYSYCTARVPLGSTGVDGIMTCIADEDLQATSLAADYASVNPAVRARCEYAALRATNGFGSYSTLTTCIYSRLLGSRSRPQIGFAKGF